MRLTGIWQSNTRKQNGHYQSAAKRGLRHVPFLHIRTRSTTFGTPYDEYNITSIPVMNTRLDVADKDSYGVDSENLDNFYFPVNRLKIGFIFPDGENRNLENAINPDEGFSLLAFNFYDTFTNDGHTKYNGKTVDQITGSTKNYQHMGITPEATADSYSGGFATQFATTRFGLASQCFLSPQLYNEGGYSKGFYTAVPEPPYGNTFNFKLISSDVLNTVEYHGSPYYRYFTIDCADNYTISMVFNKSIPFYSSIDTRIYTKGKGDYTIKNVRRFITNDKFPISATEWSNKPNPSDTVVRYINGT